MDEVNKIASRFLDGDVISIKLDGSDKTYWVQKALLQGASDYFIKALSTEFKEGIDKTLRLPGCTEDVFELFLYWLCQRTLPELNRENETSAQKTLVRLWCFADAYLMPDLQNATTSILIAHLSGSTTRPEAVREAFERTASDSVLRTVMVKELARDYKGSPGYDMEDKDYLGAIPGLMDALIETLENTHAVSLNDSRAKCKNPRYHCSPW